MSLYNEYESYALKYIEEYGKETVVLYRCGSFYEIYSINDGLVDIKALCELLNIQMSKRNKSIPEVSRNNCLMAGFPAYTLQKFINILVNENYTVVVVDQVTDPPKPKRAVTAVVSPGTDLSCVSAPDANNLIAMYFEENNEFRTKNKVLSIGIAVIDVTTGNCKVFETSSKTNDYSYALDEAYRIINIENPREVVLFGERIDNVVSLLELQGRCVHDMFSKHYDDFYNIKYQTKVLQKVYPKHGLLSVIEYLDLEKCPIATTSFVFLMEFVFKHNEHVLTKVQKPVMIESSNNLVLSYNAVKHLNILNNDTKQNTLLHILNKCVTSIGKRRFREWFLHPVVDANVMQNRYDMIDFYRANKIYEKVRRHLSDVYDIERLYRRIQLKMLHPCEINQIFTSITSILAVYSCTHKNEVQKTTDLSVFKAFLEDSVVIEEAAKYNQDTMDKNFFSESNQEYMQVCHLQRQVVSLTSFFDNLTNSLNNFVGGEFFKYDNNQVDGYHLIITSRRYRDAEQRLKSYRFQKDDITVSLSDASFKLTSSKTCFKITHPSFTTINQKIETAKLELLKCLKDTYYEFLERIEVMFCNLFTDIIKDVGDIDFFSTCAKLSIEHNYVRPNVILAETSFVDAHDVRHPIIEQITPTGYIPNDVLIGKDVQGILLYGTNMVGKSAYMKSIGLCIIMAQVGMFVPAKNFDFCPYNKIFTRIPSGDDLFKGQSTFAVEIAELRNILKRADKNSLVIGDELASGTESVSAVAIVGSGITELYCKKSSFVFATHLHDLTGLSCIKNLQHLNVCHMSVYYDETTKKLAYNRKLQEGQGNTLYGLEVCRAMDMGTSFLAMANDIRRELLEQNNHIVGTKKSTYNASHFIDTCSVCGQRADEVHHIKHQAYADENGFVGHIHKNASHNLINVCEKCHDKIHSNEIHIAGYVQTSDGIELEVSIGQQDNTEVKEDLQQKVTSLRNNQNMSLAKIKAELSKEDINISIYKIQQLLKKTNNI
jgi:DNA mismatch repair protein MutS